ncbi:MAG: glycosyltransferase family 39 protein [Acidobacteriota bacterium]|nr:glycosyltransferase family 39 protein [Acidobacteriota bacterium]
MQANARSGRELVVRWALPAITVIFFLATAVGYGVFRDELYYFACGRHLDWGYVDHPPLIALLAALVEGLGGSWVAGRWLAGLAAGATVWLTGETARELGGRPWARVTAQLLTATAPIFLALSSTFSMNVFNLLIWAALGRLAAHLLSGGEPRLWLLFGALAGIGLQNKVDVGVLGLGLAVGLMLSRRWDVLRRPWIWLGGAVAGLIFLPHVLWQMAHGWPTREFIANAQAGKIVELNPGEYALAQVELFGPVAIALALAGLGWLLFAGSAREHRSLAWIPVTAFLLFALSVSKPYYLAPAVILLFPAGAVAASRWSRSERIRQPWGRVLRVGLIALIVLGLAAAPLAKPLLPEDSYVAYAESLGFAPSTEERHELGRLPQFFADMHGWEDLAATVSGVYQSLPERDREKACFFGTNYGQAGAIDLFRDTYELPSAISGHNSYWLWGPGDCTGEVLLFSGSVVLPPGTSKAPGALHRCTDCMPYENNLTIWIIRDLPMSAQEAWPSVKSFN